MNDSKQSYIIWKAVEGRPVMVGTFYGTREEVQAVTGLMNTECQTHSYWREETEQITKKNYKEFIHA